jgi:hypothetical protein
VSALAGRNWEVGRSDAAAEVARTEVPQEALTRQTLTAIVDTMVVLVMQVVFRVTMFLRHLNY